MRYKQLLESHDTSNDVITIDEIKDICNILIDEGGYAKIELIPRVSKEVSGEIFTLKYQITFQNPHLFTEYKVAKQMLDNVIDRFKDKVHPKQVLYGIIGKEYQVYIPLDIRVSTVSATLTEEEVDMLDYYIGLDLARIGYEDFEQDILNSIDPKNLVLDTKQWDLLCDFLCLDLEKIGFEDHEINLLYNVHSKIRQYKLSLKLGSFENKAYICNI